MVSLRKSRKLALLAAAGARTNRRSARLVELEERKRLEAEAARAAAAAEAAAAAAAAAAAGAQGVRAPAPTNGDQVTGRKRGRKRKHVDEVIVSSVYEQQGQSSQWQPGPSITGTSSYFAGTPLPSKKTLESVLDVLQMMDSDSMLAMPKSFEVESTELANNLSRPRDFGTVRAKLHEGYYATFEHFESDVFSITARAKRSDPPETPVHKLASDIEQRAAEVFRALRTQPGFDLYVMNWATNNRKTTGQLRIGGGSAAGASGAAGGNEPGRATAGGRPRSAGGNRGLRKAAGARARGRRRTVSEVHAGAQGLTEDRRLGSKRLKQAQEMYAVMLENSRQLVKDIRVGTDISYEESLMRFASAGGPTAEKIARKVMEEERAAAMDRLQMRNQLPSAPVAAAQWNPPTQYNNGDFVSPAPHLSRPRSGPAPAQGNMLSLGRQQGEAAVRPSPVFYDLTLEEAGTSARSETTGTGGFAFPPPSILASTSAGTPGFGTRQQSHWLSSDVGSSSAGYKFYPDAANVPPASTMVGDGSAFRDGLVGEGSSYAGFLFGPRKLNYIPLFPAASTSLAPVYQTPAPAPTPQADMCDFLQLGSCNKISSHSSSIQLPPVDPVDGFQYLLSVDDICPDGFAPNVDASAAQFSPSGKGKAPMDPQPEPTSQAVFDLKLLQSRLGENPWGKNGISSLRGPCDYTGAMNASNPSSMEAEPSSSKRNVELSTLNLLGGRNPDLNLNL